MTIFDDISIGTQKRPLTIGILGAGKIGAILAHRLGALGHSVSLANSRGPETIANLAAETGATAVAADDVAKDAELLIVSVPVRAILQLPENLFDTAQAGAIIVDTCNYFPARDGRIESIEDGLAESRWVSERIGRPVTKAFNSISANSFAILSAGSTNRIALPVSGDDDASKAIVIGLADAMGFDAVDAGSLDESWRQQPGAPAFCTDYGMEGLIQALARADRARLPEARKSSIEKIAALPRGYSQPDLVALLRSIQ